MAVLHYARLRTVGQNCYRHSVIVLRSHDASAGFSRHKPLYGSKWTISFVVSHLTKQLVIQMFSVGWRRRRPAVSLYLTDGSVVHCSDLWRSVNKSPVGDPLDWTQSAKLCRLKLIESVSSARTLVVSEFVLQGLGVRTLMNLMETVSVFFTKLFIRLLKIRL